MSIVNSLLSATGITLVSVIAITFVYGMPTPEQAIKNSIVMFIMAFVVMKFWGGDKKQDDSK